ncbi:hypothetical protein KFK09_020139 [Dendrobium nobile]|uniref:Uncharacterized protein n=1 Tax=Dendrobium nobile TaxID=94219 RepID=A0A8T3ARH0_DENNO|nr:hypothetical protein KFK09_020139 [Dendrobium nobile]
METLKMAPISAWAAPGESLLASAGVYDPEKWAAEGGARSVSTGARISPGGVQIGRE